MTSENTKRLSISQQREANEALLSDLANSIDDDTLNQTMEWVEDELNDPRSPISRVFKVSGLNDQVTGHWKILTYQLAEFHYSDNRGVPKTSWSTIELKQLLRDADQIKSTLKLPERSREIEAICHVLVKRPEYLLKTGTTQGKRRSPSTLVTRISSTLTLFEKMLRSPFSRTDEFLPHEELEFEHIIKRFRPNTVF